MGMEDSDHLKLGRLRSSGILLSPHATTQYVLQLYLSTSLTEEFYFASAKLLGSAVAQW